MTISTESIQKIDAGDCRLVASLPDMGRVGGIVSSYLALHLKAKPVAEFRSADKPWVSYTDGLVSAVTDTYTLHYHAPAHLLIFAGASQPQDATELYKLCNALLDVAQSMGNVTRVYSAGGYLRESLTGAPRVCGAVNRKELMPLLAGCGIEPIGNEIKTITWFNGLILGIAAERGIDGVGLFGEISETSVPQPLAAKSIISAFSRIEKIPVDTKPLDAHYESVLDEVLKKKEQPKYGAGED